MSYLHRDGTRKYQLASLAARRRSALQTLRSSSLASKPPSVVFTPVRKPSPGMFLSLPPAIQLLTSREKLPKQMKIALYISLMVNRQRFPHGHAAAMQRIPLNGLPMLDGVPFVCLSPLQLLGSLKLGYIHECSRLQRRLNGEWDELGCVSLKATEAQLRLFLLVLLGRRVMHAM